MDVRALQERVLRELAAIGFAKATDYLYVDGDKLVIKSTEELSEAAGAAVASVERTSSGIRVKLYDKLKALELLGKYTGLFDSRTAGQGQEENNLLEAILAATQEEMDTSDIPEIQQASESCADMVEPPGVSGL